ncbi:MAG: DUF664 domain-containing protein [Anaerolineales bacterium]|nr:DUF664 domain-containing protein [Anaerolineales bacterium]
MGDLHEECKMVMNGLSQDALDWKPGRRMNSIGILVVHLIGAERYWFGDVVMQETSGRQRDQEFQSRGLNSIELARRLDDALGYIRNSLDSLSLEDLTEIRTSPRDGTEFTIGWSILHVLRHTALHLGHMEDVRHMWGMRSTDQ